MDRLQVRKCLLFMRLTLGISHVLSFDLASAWTGVYLSLAWHWGPRFGFQRLEDCSALQASERL